jgi:hypothetical protein
MSAALPTATIGSSTFRHALTTDVGLTGGVPGLSVLTLNLEGRYTRFRATVGLAPAADERKAALEPGAYFEVWGDGNCLYRLGPLYPAAGEDGRPHAGTATPTVDLVILGTRTLQIVTRYAPPKGAAALAGSGTASDALVTHGCMWGDPALLTSTVAAPPPIAKPAAAPDVASPLPLQTSSPASTARFVPSAATAHPMAPSPRSTPSALTVQAQNRPDDAAPAPLPSGAVAGGARSDVIRQTVLLVAAMISGPDDVSGATAFPLRLILMPISHPGAATSDTGHRRRGRRGGVSTATDLDETLARLLAAHFGAVRRGDAPMFVVIDDRDALRSLPPDATNAVGETVDPVRFAPISAALRRVGAQVFAVATVSAPTSTASGTEASLSLTLYDAGTGSLLCTRTQPLPAP